MEKEITIAWRYWGTQNRRARIVVHGNKTNVQGYSIGYRNSNVIGPRVENVAEVPQKLRKEIIAISKHRCPELSKDFSAFTAEIWKKAQKLNNWFDY